MFCTRRQDFHHRHRFAKHVWGRYLEYMCLQNVWSVQNIGGVKAPRAPQKSRVCSSKNSQQWVVDMIANVDQMTLVLVRWYINSTTQIVVRKSFAQGKKGSLNLRHLLIASRLVLDVALHRFWHYLSSQCRSFGVDSNDPSIEHAITCFTNRLSLKWSKVPVTASSEIVANLTYWAGQFCHGYEENRTRQSLALIM